MKVKLLIFIILFIGSITVCGCEKSDQELNTVRVAVFPNLTHAQGLINISEGSFQKTLEEEITVEWKYFNSGNSEIEAFFADEIDIGFIGPVPAINGFVKSNGEIKIISGAMNSGALLIAREDSDIETIADLEGKKVAVPSFGNTQDFMLRMMLDEVGLMEITQGGNVEIIPVKNPDLQSFFSQGYIDAAFVPEPWGSQLINQIGAKLIIDAQDTWRNGEYPTTVIITRKSFIEEHPDVVKDFLKTHVEITNTFNNQQEELINIVNQEITNITGSEVSIDTLDKAYSRMLMTLNPEREAIEQLARAMKERDFIDKDVDIDELLDYSILNQVLFEINEEQIK